MTPEELLQGLLSRLTPPKNYDENKAKLIQLRTTLVLKHWIKNQFEDFDSHLIEEINRACSEILPSIGLKDTAESISTLISQKIKYSKYHAPYLPEIDLMIPTVVGSPGDLFHAIAPEEIARQLALISMDQFKKIGVSELMNQAWSIPKLQYLSPNVISLIRRTDKVSFWVASTILSEPNLKQRAVIVKNFLSIARCLHSFQDFNTLMGIIVGLNTSSVSRLKKTFSSLTEEDMEEYKFYETLMSPAMSFKAYRDTVTKVNPPCVPFFALYLSDLTFIDEGNVDKIDGLINIEKRKQVYEVIARVQLYQNESYSFQRVEPLATYLEILPQFGEAQIYNLSLAVEPREALASPAQEKREKKKSIGSKLKKKLRKSQSFPKSTINSALSSPPPPPPPPTPPQISKSSSTKSRNFEDLLTDSELFNNFHSFLALQEQSMLEFFKAIHSIHLQNIAPEKKRTDALTFIKKYHDILESIGMKDDIAQVEKQLSSEEKIDQDFNLLSISYSLTRPLIMKLNLQFQQFLRKKQN
eukprot:TRINITY_DN3936_c0_g1_i3.p1 TRINITY_DN3936_c0_g1~~TRINITY_DN3936_c0_g1_i3.p1  ORF type:complete len:527 (+),score=108.14 TRINITY_DN3936_c0_g1_i3:1378-2958(+)